MFISVRHLLLVFCWLYYFSASLESTSTSLAVTAFIPTRHPYLPLPTHLSLYKSFSSSLFYHNSTFMSPRIVRTDSPALQHFFDTVIQLQQAEDDVIQLCRDNDTNDDDDSASTPLSDDVPINSIVFQVLTTMTKDTNQQDNQQLVFPETTQPSCYVLAVLAADDFVNASLLEEVVAQRLGWETDERRSLLRLAPPDQVQSLCGFAPGTVPPLGCCPAPLLTLVDESLLHRSRQWMLGGGGMAGQACRFRLDALLGLEGVVMEPIREEGGRGKSLIKTTSAVSSTTSSTTSTGTTSTSLAESIPSFHSQQPTIKPFFPVETPPIDVAARVIADSSLSNPLTPTEVSLVARIARVRRMARRLVFCDVVPPEVTTDATMTQDATNTSQTLRHYWRSPVHGQDMSVQLIAGKTLCERLGKERGELLLRKGLQVGQLVWIRGKTNVGNRESLRNWIEKQSMDIILWDCTPLTSDTSVLDSVGLSPVNGNAGSREPFLKHSKSVLPIRPNGHLFVREQPTLPPGMSYLKLDNIFEGQHEVVVVDSGDTVQEFQRDVKKLLSKNRGSVELTGLDCEWKPTFLLNSRHEEQPVLVLQISLHSLKKVYVWDLQSLLRPLLDPSEPRTNVEEEVSNIFSVFFQSTQFVKLGFQLIHDLRRLTASYPNIPGFAQVEAVLELSRVAKKSTYLAQQPNSHAITSSLRNMVHHFLQYGLDKTEQCSDWSLRPLTEAQIEYAALDAAVTPKLLERVMDPIQARVFARPHLQMGRWLDDTAFSNAIQSWRFLFLDPSNGVAIRRLQAKSTVGSSVFLVTQSWRTGYTVPTKPSVPSADGPFTDAQGVFRIPAKLIELKPSLPQVHQVLNRYIGERVAKTKDRCVAALMQAVPSVSMQLENGARVDFPQRSGYVEFADAAILFVNMPMRPWARKARSYPNEWLQDGQILTWFLRESEWKGGSTALARKLLSPEHPVFLFVRLGKGHFLCCGQCEISTDDGSESDIKRNWDLVKLYLTLSEWNTLNVSPSFLDMVHPGKYSYDDLCSPPDDWDSGSVDDRSRDENMDRD